MVGKNLHLKVCFAMQLGGKKRPAWDTKGRLEDMEVALSRHLEQNTSLQQQILSSNERIAQLESMNCQLKGTVQQREEMTTQARDEIDALQRRLRYGILLLLSTAIFRIDCFVFSSCSPNVVLRAVIVDPIQFQARHHRKRPKLALVF